MLKEFRADLHCHTTCSDGSYTPTELIRHAKEIGLSGLSITDHDNIEAYQEIAALAEEKGLPLVSGVEFSCSFQNTSIHVLGYAFPLDSPLIHAFCQRHIKRREERNRAILEKLAQHKMPIPEESLGFSKKRGVIGRPHIAQAMVMRGYVHSINEAFHRFLGEGKPCYTPGEAMSVEETIDCLHRAGGKAVIAHPHLIAASNIIPALLELPFDGIEVYYGRFFADKIDRWQKIAEKKGWLATGGSDFHGTIKPNISLGCSWAPEEVFHYLRKLFLENSRSV